MHAHRRVLEHRDAPREVGDHLGRKLALLGDGGGELARVLLDVADVRLELRVQLLQVLHDRALDRLGQVRVVVRDQARLLALREGSGMGSAERRNAEGGPGRRTTP